MNLKTIVAASLLALTSRRRKHPHPYPGTPRNHWSGLAFKPDKAGAQQGTFARM